MIFKSKLPDIEIPSIGVYQHVTSNPYNISEDKEIFVDGITDKKLSFGEFKRKSKRFAAGLHDKVGFQRGDVLAIISPNQVDYPIVLFGAIAAGDVAEISFQLSDSGTSVIVTHPFFVSMVAKAAAEAQIPHSKVFLFGNEEVDGFQPCSSLFVDRDFEPIEYTPEESKNTTVLLCYSSGTTGKSKGVETTHTNMIASVRQMVSFETEFGPHNIFMGILPFFHIYGLQVLLHFALILGASVVLLPKFDLRTFCSVIQSYKVNYAHLVPPILLLLAKSPIVKEYDLSSLRTITSSAAPLSTRLAADIYKIYNIHVKQGYGLTEASPLVSLVDEKNIVQGIMIFDILKSSIGVIVSNIEAKIISEDGK
ncbi:4402_t:CDS:2, partial [Acaulospora morrowiae]